MSREKGEARREKREGSLGFSLDLWSSSLAIRQSRCKHHFAHSFLLSIFLVSIFLVSIFLLFTSCNDDLVSNKYCNLPARFTFSPVSSISQLNSSCNNPGEWCTITLSGNKFYFTKSDGSQGEANRTAIEGYTGFYMGLSGFIVGLPNIPEMGESVSVVTCYDLACRNCYDNFSVTKRMTLQESGYAQCPSCNRTYNLNNTGIVSSGDAGKPLFRYRVYFNGNTLSINN